jgi:hypothetical protein
LNEVLQQKLKLIKTIDYQNKNIFYKLSSVLKKFYVKFYFLLKMENSERIIEGKPSIIEKSEKLLNAGRLTIIIVTGLILIFSIVGLGLMVSSYSSEYNSVKKNGYGESCLSNQCEDTRLLKCITGKCQCDIGTSFYNTRTSRCEPLRLESRYHGTYCKQGITQCQNDTKCINSICQCDASTYYWTGYSCNLKLNYNSDCSISVFPSTDSKNCLSDYECNQCLTSSHLTCDSIYRKCLCSSNIYYYDSILATCAPLKTYYTPCKSSLECDSSADLFCQTISSSSASNCPGVSMLNYCDCSNSQYFDTIYSKCLAKKGYNRPCFLSCECDYQNKGLECYNGFCMCPKNKYFNSISCTAAYIGYYNSRCSSNLDCDIKLGLTCSNVSICDCGMTKSYYWNSNLKLCIECPDGWVVLKASNSVSKCYFISSYSDYWTNARKFCESDYAQLLYIKDVYEYNALYNYLSINFVNTFFHIGLYTQSGYYYWTDGTYIEYSISCSILSNASLFYFPSYGYCCGGCYSNSYGTMYTNVTSFIIYMYDVSLPIRRYICKKIL